jgi:lipoyl(octanoyl) transferase
MKPLYVRQLGLCEYQSTVVLQEELVRQRRAGEIADTLLLLEHEPVITVGKAGLPPSPKQGGGVRGAAPAAAGAPVALAVPIHETSRGGQATYHGPGQLVMYPILDLREWRCDLHEYLRQLEEVVIRALAGLGLDGTRVEGYTGVWVGERKIASIGVAVRGWITYHGVALNVSNDMTGFSLITPCGLPAEVMTRVVDHGVTATVGELLPLAEQAFRDVFGYD